MAASWRAQGLREARLWHAPHAHPCRTYAKCGAWPCAPAALTFSYHRCALGTHLFLRTRAPGCVLAAACVQGDSYLFNRGALLNAGALLLEGSSYDYFVFQVGDLCVCVCVCG